MMSIFITYHWTETWLITTAVIGISLLEKALVVIEALALAYYGFISSVQRTVVAGLLISFIVSIWLMLTYLFVF
jgi:hypothetical protein